MMTDKVVAIHQPNFFPWLGFFDKIDRADVFVVLDDVQYPRKGSSWGNRVKLMISGKSSWFTAPIVRVDSKIMHNEIIWDKTKPWRVKLMKTLEINYRRAKHFPEVMPLLEPLILDEELNMSLYNIQVIEGILNILSLDATKVVRSSGLDHSGSANDLLASLVKKVGGTTYLSGDGAGGYLDRTIFDKQGITLELQQFRHPVYDQYGSNEFQPGLSIIDCLMNVGAAETSKMLKNA